MVTDSVGITPGAGALVATYIVTEDVVEKEIQRVALNDQLGNEKLSFQDGGTAFTTSWGVAGAPYTSADRSGSKAAVTDAPGGGLHIVLDDLIISVDTQMSVTFYDSNNDVIIGPIYCPAYSGPMQFTPRSKLKLAVATSALSVQTSIAGNISVLAGYHIEA